MVVTVVLSGIPQHIPLVELAAALDKFIRSDEVGTFVARELPTHYSKGKRQVALDFQDGFNAMAAQETLNGYRYKLPDDTEYTLSARVTKEPSLMPNKELVPYNSRGSSYRKYDDEVQAQLRALESRLKVVRTETELIGAEKNLRKLKRKYLLNESDSDSVSTSRRKHKKKGKKKKRRRRSSTSSSESTAPSLHSPGPLASSSAAKYSARKRPDTRGSPVASSSRYYSPERSVVRSKSGRKRRHTSSERSASRHKSSERSASRHKLSKRSTSRHKSSKRSASQHKSSERSTSRQKSSESSTSRHKSSERSTSRHNSSERSTRRHKSREKSTSRHKSSERSTRRHKSRERSTRRHKSRERSARRHKSRERSTGRHKSSERSTGRHKSSERSTSRRSPDYISSSSRSRRRQRTPPLSPSPVAHSSRRSTHRSGESYRDYYRDPCEDAYTGMMYKSRQYDSQMVYVNRHSDKYDYLRPAGLLPSPCPPHPRYPPLPPHATVIEIQDGEDGEIADDDVDEVLNAIDDLVEDYEEDPEASPRCINVKINVVPRKRDADLLVEDQIMTEDDKVTEKKKANTMPRPMVDDSLNVKKEHISRRYDDETRQAMPRPIIEEPQEPGNIMVWQEIIKIKDDPEISYRPQKKKIARNPRFVMAVSKVLKKMNSHIKDIDEGLKRTFLPIMRKILRIRIKNLLAGQKIFTPTAAILDMYRETFPKENDCGLVMSVLDHMREGKFDGFVPSSDDEDEKNKDKNKRVADAPIPEIFQTYVTGKSVTSNGNDNEDVIILEKKVDIIDMTDIEEGGTIKEEPTSTPDENASHTICIDCEEEENPIVKTEYENTNDVGISVKTEVDRSEAAKDSVKGINLANIKAEIITEMPKVVAVKSENVESVANINTQGNQAKESCSGDDIRAREEITLVKSEPTYEAIGYATDIATEETAGPSQANRDEVINETNGYATDIATEETAGPSQANRDKVINETNTPTKEKESSTKNSPRTDDSVKKNKAKGKDSVKKSKKKSKDTGKRTDKSGKAGTDAITAQKTDKGAEKEQTSVKEETPEEPEESLESIEKFVDLHTKVTQID